MFETVLLPLTAAALGTGVLVAAAKGGAILSGWNARLLGGFLVLQGLLGLLAGSRADAAGTWAFPLQALALAVGAGFLIALAIRFRFAQLPPLRDRVATAQPLLTDFLAAVDDPTAVLNSQGVVLACNRRWTNPDENFLAAGTVPGENYLKHCERLAAAGDAVATQAAQAIRDANTVGESESEFETDHQATAEPKPSWRRIRIRPLEHGGLAITHQDVTREKLAEAERDAVEERYQSLFQQIPVIMHAVDAEGRLTDVSTTWSQSLGYPREEALGRNWIKLLTPDGQHYAETVTWPAFLDSGRCRDVSLQFLKRNGETMDVLLSAVGERDARGRLVRSVAILHDVTEGKQAEIGRFQLMEEQQKFVSLVQNATDFIGIWNFHGDCLFVNHAGKTLVGLTEDRRIQDARLADFYQPETASILTREVLPLIQDAEHW
ncbi:MAG: PAS domain S-box protein, partial [Planctomycetales bacterium]